MIYSEGLDNLRKHYGLDKLYAELDYDKPHRSPCKKFVDYEYCVHVKMGDLRFEFQAPVHWQRHEIKVPFWNFWDRIFVGKYYVTYTVDEFMSYEYVTKMIHDVLEKENDDESF